MKRLGTMLAAIAVGGAGCGGSESDADKVRTSVTTYLTALADGDATKACDQLNGEAKRGVVDYVSTNIPEFKATSCDAALRALGENLGGDEKSALRDAEIEKVSINNDRATATLKGAASDPELIKVDGRWYISGGLFEDAATGADPSGTVPEPDSEEPSQGVGGAAAGETAAETADRVLSQYQDLGYVQSSVVGDALAVKVKVGTSRAKAEELCNAAAGAVVGKGISTIVVLSEKQATEGDLAQCAP